MKARIGDLKETSSLHEALKLNAFPLEALCVILMLTPIILPRST